MTEYTAIWQADFEKKPPPRPIAVFHTAREESLGGKIKRLRTCSTFLFDYSKIRRQNYLLESIWGKYVLR